MRRFVWHRIQWHTFFAFANFGHRVRNRIVKHTLGAAVFRWQRHRQLLHVTGVQFCEIDALSTILLWHFVWTIICCKQKTEQRKRQEIEFKLWFLMTCHLSYSRHWIHVWAYEWISHKQAIKELSQRLMIWPTERLPERRHRMAPESQIYCSIVFPARHLIGQ